uniref:Uncharacterized protein n=1 Tax=Timema cristinae TaxID=61476 RepID=A0A7R9CEK9_TIMCR|nr:unnamed protein product [Timema cristinae]
MHFYYEMELYFYQWWNEIFIFRGPREGRGKEGHDRRETRLLLRCPPPRPQFTLRLCSYFRREHKVNTFSPEHVRIIKSTNTVTPWKSNTNINSGVQAQSYIIRKCCPLSQQLDITLENCVDLKKQPSQYSKDLESKPNASLLENSSNPWWIPEDTMVLSSLTLEPISDFFSSQIFLKGIAAGDWKPCGLSSTKIIVEGFDLLDNGSLVLDVEDSSGEKTKNLVYPPSSFCSDSVYLGIEPASVA